MTEAARAELDSLPRTIQIRMVALFRRLQAWPTVSGAKPLTGNLAGQYRMRTGDYRLRFRAEGNEVIVEQVGHRDRFYEK